MNERPTVDGPALEAKAKIKQVLEQLRCQFTQEDMARALEGLLLDLCWHQYKESVEAASWAKTFLPEVAYHFYKLEEDILDGEAEAAAVIRNKDAGGTGNYLN